MATLTREELSEAMYRLGELADVEGIAIELLLFGGSVMVLAFGSRASTRDVDAVVLGTDPAVVRRFAAVVADERGWPADWLNDAVKGFAGGAVPAAVILQGPGITAYRPSLERLLAMKLAAWRDQVDIDDAKLLLRQLGAQSRDEVRSRVLPLVQPGRELLADLAIQDLWEDLYG